MTTRARLAAHLRAQWAGLLALFLVLAGGTAWAANEWTGANIVNGSLTGLDVAANSLEGVDVLESSLGKVPNADKLDGLNSSRFTQGEPAIAGSFSSSTGRTYFNRVVNPFDSGTSTILVIPGVLHVDGTCTQEAELLVTSDDDDLDAFYYRNGQPADRIRAIPGAGITMTTSAGNTTRYIAYQAGTGANTFGGQKLVTIHAFIGRDLTAGDCTFQVSALVQET